MVMTGLLTPSYVSLENAVLSKATVFTRDKHKKRNKSVVNLKHNIML